MSALAGLLILFALVAILWRAIRGGARVRSFSPRRAQLRTRRATGDNALLMLAAVQVATLGFDIAEAGAATRISSNLAGLLIPVVMVVGVILLVADRALGDLALGALGIASAFASASMHYGTSGAVSVLVMAMLVLVVLGFVRGFVRST